MFIQHFMIYEIYESIVESLMEIIKQISEHKKKNHQMER